MNSQNYAELTGPDVWLGPDIQNDDDWNRELGPDSIADLDAALRHAQKAGVEIPFGKEDFPLTAMADELEKIVAEVRNGRGFSIIRGIPRERYSDRECEIIYWGIGAYIGQPISQNARGHLLGHVIDEGRVFQDPMARGYQTARRMDFHNDLMPVDVLGLFCLRQAKSGGESHLVSSLTVHNVLRRERPDVLDVLYRSFYLDWRGEEPEGHQPWYSIPMFSAEAGKISSRFCNRDYYQSCERFGKEYCLTDEQNEALDIVQDIANRPELRVTMRFEGGDIQLLNNHVTMHGRNDFEDYDDPKLQRHLLRMWICLPDDQRRPLSPAIDSRYEVVKQGGIPVRDVA